MVAFCTGNEGFVGKHFTKELEKQGIGWVGFDKKNGQDITNYEQVRTTLDLLRPDYIFHLAAQAFVPESRTNPHRTYQVNLYGALNILEAVRQLGIKPKIMLCGTSEEYGDDTEIHPKSHYAISKAAQDYMGQMYAEVDGLHVVRTRAFNHTGPGRGEMYADSSWAKQIVEIERGQREYLEHGDLSTIRNYNDVRDIVRGYVMAINSEPGWYNICSKENPTMQEILDILIAKSECKIKTKVNTSLFRPDDFSFVPPKCTLKGYKPKYSLEQTVEDVLSFWRERV